MAFPVIVTTAGQALIAGAQAFVIDKIALGSGQRTPDGTETSITPLSPAEEDTNPTGSREGNDTLSFKYQDTRITQGAIPGSAYDVGEIGLFSGSTLVFYASQPAADGFLFQKAATAPLLVTFRIQFATTNVTQVSFSGGDFAGINQASELARGTLEIATEAEAVAGADDARAMTPLKVKKAIETFGVVPQVKMVDGANSPLVVSNLGFYPTSVLGIRSGQASTRLISFTMAVRDGTGTTATITQGGYNTAALTSVTFAEDGVTIVGSSSDSRYAYLIFGHKSLA